MSYILEALKKAQAERQLGNAPTIHAPVVHALPVARARRLPLVALAVAAVVVLGAALFAWRQHAATVPPASPPPAVAAAPRPVAPAAPQVALLPGPVVAPAPKPPTRPAASGSPAVAASRAGPVQAPVAGDTARTLNDLPEALRREVPKVVFGGYIYAPNPADRLLLVDKMLRREGDEVAPGLVLEKLLPNAAIMSFRGERYRVPY